MRLIVVYMVIDLFPAFIPNPLLNSTKLQLAPNNAIQAYETLKGLPLGSLPVRFTFAEVTDINNSASYPLRVLGLEIQIVNKKLEV